MTETPAEYQARRAAEAVRAEAAAVRSMANHLLGVIVDANSPARPAHLWRAALQQVYERIGEAVGNG